MTSAFPPASCAATRAGVVVSVVSTHVAPARGFGGIAECVARLSHAWSVQGHRFRLCSSDASLGGALSVEDVGLPAAIPVDLFAARRFPRFALGWGALAAVWRSCQGADVVYVNGLATWPTTLAGLLALVLRRPLVVAPHAGLMAPHVALIRSRKPHKWLFYKVLTLPTVRRAVTLHLTSPLEVDGLEALVPGVPWRIVPNGLDLCAWRPLPRPTTGGPGITLCYVGRFSAEKGILRFLRAWRARRGVHDRFILVGDGDGPYAEALRREADGLGDAIERHAYLDSRGVQEVFRRADMLVLPSGLENGDLRENFGNVVAEALASARPVMVTKGLAWDAAECEGFGILFEPTDEGIADALSRASGLEPATLAAMGDAGRRYAERHLDIQATAARLWHICAEAASP